MSLSLQTDSFSLREKYAYNNIRNLRINFEKEAPLYYHVSFFEKEEFLFFSLFYKLKHEKTVQVYIFRRFSLHKNREAYKMKSTHP